MLLTYYLIKLNDLTADGGGDYLLFVTTIRACRPRSPSSWCGASAPPAGRCGTSPRRMRGTTFAVPLGPSTISRFVMQPFSVRRSTANYRFCSTLLHFCSTTLRRSSCSTQRMTSLRPPCRPSPLGTYRRSNQPSRPCGRPCCIFHPCSSLHRSKRSRRPFCRPSSSDTYRRSWCPLCHDRNTHTRSRYRRLPEQPPRWAATAPPSTWRRSRRWPAPRSPRTSPASRFRSSPEAR